MSKPLKSILDREKPAQEAQRIFADTTALLREIADYGSNLIVRCHACGQRDPDVADLVLLGALGKHAVAMVDAFEVNLNAAAMFGAQLAARSLLDASLSLHWMLKKDTEKRAAAYYVFHIRKKRDRIAAAIPGTQENEAFQSALDDSPGLQNFLTSGDTPGLAPEAQLQVAKIDQCLSQPCYSGINDEFNRKRGTQLYDRHWGVPFGVGSIRQMAKELQRLPEYNIFYGDLSSVSHASDFSQHIAIQSGGRAVFEPIRNLRSLRHSRLRDRNHTLQGLIGLLPA